MRGVVVCADKIRYANTSTVTAYTKLNSAQTEALAAITRKLLGSENSGRCKARMWVGSHPGYGNHDLTYSSLASLHRNAAFFGLVRWCDRRNPEIATRRAAYHLNTPSTITGSLGNHEVWFHKRGASTLEPRSQPHLGITEKSVAAMPMAQLGAEALSKFDWILYRAPLEYLMVVLSAYFEVQMDQVSAGSLHEPSLATGASPSPLAAVTAPSGGGAIQGIGETFSVSGPTGTASASIPLPTSTARSGSTPKLTLTYDSGSGNGPFGLGWQLSVPSITRKTYKGLPQYLDDEESDVFMMSGAEDFVPVLEPSANGWIKQLPIKRTSGQLVYQITTYRPRVEAEFARIERWSDSDTGIAHWRAVSKDNVTSIFGDTKLSRISDPACPSRIFSWLLSRTYDDKGNLTHYDYKAENSEGVDESLISEQHRSYIDRTASRYLKRVRYGNVISHKSVKDHDDLNFYFEVVFDYGEHSPHIPTPRECRHWNARQDPFSSFRSTFEIRTYRLCERVLMFHHFPDEPTAGKDCLVSSMELHYSSQPTVTLLTSATQKGFRKVDGQWFTQSLPPLEFEYSQPTIADDAISLGPRALENVPVGVADTNYQFLDLDAEGLPGLLTHQSSEWFYKPNLGGARFGPMQVLPQRPTVTEGGSQIAQWLDLSGDGKLDLVRFQDTAPGFYRRDNLLSSGWEPFRHFLSIPNINWSVARMIDLTGNGLADILITDDQLFTAYASLGDSGFNTAEYWRPPVDEDGGPRLLLHDDQQNIFLADMSGDGLADIVRICNGEVCYWPNLGYGRFGRKHCLADAPFFDLPDMFTRQRIILADVDGTGTTDLILLHPDGPTVYINEAGNSLSAPRLLENCPPYDDMKSVNAIDLLGQGTACLTFSSKLLSDENTGRQLFYLDLMTNGKPYLLNSVKNNLGSETYITYESSTTFYVQDKLAGRSWHTNLPFPVQVVSKVTTVDRISGNQFTSKYAYHEGFFDPYEREYRGFGLVEKWDKDEFDKFQDFPERLHATNTDSAFTSPPVLTRSWYDTGALIGGYHIAQSLLYQDCNSIQYGAHHLPISTPLDTIRTSDKEIPHIITIEEMREAFRSVRGTLLREEVFGLDGSQHEAVPYLVQEANSQVELFQPMGPNRHAVFFVRPCESLKVYYERCRGIVTGSLKEDPRVSHSMLLETDMFGNPLVSVSIAYGRQNKESSIHLNEKDQQKQAQTHCVLQMSAYTNRILEPDTYRLPVQWESQSFELRGLVEGLSCAHALEKCCQNKLLEPKLNERKGGRTSLVLLSFSAVALLVKSFLANPIDEAFEGSPTTEAPNLSNSMARRLLSRKRTAFRSDDMSTALPFGVLEPLGLPYESYTQVLTPGLAKHSYLDPNRIDPSNIDAVLENQCGYVKLDGDSNYWAPFGRVFFSPKELDTPVEERQYAERHFFLPHRHRNPFHTPSFNTEMEVRFDKYDLLPIESRDSVGNIISAGVRAKGERFGQLTKTSYDYQHLRPLLVMDGNRNCTTYAFDALGIISAIAIQGKPEESLGDNLGDFHWVSDEETDEFFNSPISSAESLLGNATSRMIHDLHAYHRTRSSVRPSPIVAATISREMHVSDLAPTQRPRLQLSFVYQDGLGRIAQKQTLASDEIKIKCPRWLTTGWTRYNDKGSAVQKYEPFFSESHHYLSDSKHGVCSTYLLDPLQRTAATLSPNQTWSKNVLTPWAEKVWDANDTCTIDPVHDPDVGGYFKKLPEAFYSPTWYEARQNNKLGVSEADAAMKAAAHAGTPTTAYYDSIGRKIVVVMEKRELRPHGTVESINFVTRVDYDASGNIRGSFDKLGRQIEVRDYDMLGQTIHNSSMDNGERWTLKSCLGDIVRQWTNRDQELSTEYDESRRPIRVYLRPDKGSDERHLITEITFGESLEDAEELNAKGRMVAHRDQSGVTKSERYDYKGNLLRESKQVTAEAGAVIDWSCAAHVPLQGQIFLKESTYDALNRSIAITEPDGSTVRNQYNQAGQVHYVEVQRPEDTKAQIILRSAHYNARGQRTQTIFGNGVETVNSYEADTFRLSRLLTTRRDGKQQSTAVLQDLRYTYDPVSNVTMTRDEAQRTIFYGGEKVDPVSAYTYDSTYRLIEATGREHLGQDSENWLKSIPSKHHSHDNKAMCNYHESYQYDANGNITKVRHVRKGGAEGSWSRHYRYEEPSLLEPERFSNRLTSTMVGTEEMFYKYEGQELATGNITTLPGVGNMRWDFRGQLQSVITQRCQTSPETTWYAYDDGGKRSRKATYASVSENSNKVRHERLYVGSSEVYREYAADGRQVKLERWTLHVSIGGERVSMIERLSKGESKGPNCLTRFQHGNLIGSSVLELDAEAHILTYEEYFPYGETSYYSPHSKLETPKRYRYSGKERDEESGLDYYGKRYSAAWIGRWISPDPGGYTNGPNPYQFTQSNPISFQDPDGAVEAIPTPGGVPGMPPPASASVISEELSVFKSASTSFQNISYNVQAAQEAGTLGTTAAETAEAATVITESTTTATATAEVLTTSAAVGEGTLATGGTVAAETGLGLGAGEVGGGALLTLETGGLILIAAGVALIGYGIYRAVKDDSPAAPPAKQPEAPSSQAAQSASPQEPQMSLPEDNQSRIAPPAPETVEKGPVSAPGLNYTPAEAPGASEAPESVELPGQSTDNTTIEDPTENISIEASKDSQGREWCQHRHHMIPQRHRDFFSQNIFEDPVTGQSGVSINIDLKELIRVLPQWAHTLLHQDGAYDAMWDLQVEHWKEVIAAGGKVTVEEVWDFAIHLQYETEVRLGIEGVFNGKRQHPSRDFEPKQKKASTKCVSLQSGRNMDWHDSMSFRTGLLRYLNHSKWHTVSKNQNNKQSPFSVHVITASNNLSYAKHRPVLGSLTLLGSTTNPA
ncbi:SpvB-domain-containing protein [Lindgomyces ingoldianus]|uniref:SpvB-domain-containing protein n=1 Tax=Lindgomyces ingoldianus TaxID=673940 RepID=A0ACB6QEV1_9PLEO|nr:SpvB-domain-containing protein [Lindgomyces ingoldianus]KAF2464647.1 SpvB-domain-containing protein [Lindgomyces ingoldianus]